MESKRYTCTLSKELLEKAVKELNEPTDNDVRLAEIDKLRTRFMEEDNGMELIRSDDAFLLRFLRVRKFDQDRAYQCLCNYHEQRRNWPEVFAKVNKPELIADFLDLGSIISLGKIAKDGTFVIIDRPGFGWKDAVDMTDYFSTMALTLEKLLENEEFQINGITIITEMSDFGIVFALKIASNGQQFMQLIQDSMPVRIKSMELINEALVFDLLYTIMSPFMKQKFKDRIVLNGTDFDKLHEKIPANLLPKCLGGTGPPLNAQAWKSQILSTLGSGEETSL